MTLCFSKLNCQRAELSFFLNSLSSILGPMGVFLSTKSSGNLVLPLLIVFVAFCFKICFKPLILSSAPWGWFKLASLEVTLLGIIFSKHKSNSLTHGNFVPKHIVSQLMEVSFNNAYNFIFTNADHTLRLQFYWDVQQPQHHYIANKIITLRHYNSDLSSIKYPIDSTPCPPWTWMTSLHSISIRKGLLIQRPPKLHQSLLACIKKWLLTHGQQTVIPL